MGARTFTHSAEDGQIHQRLRMVTEPSRPDLLRHLPQNGTEERPGLICAGHEISLLTLLMFQSFGTQLWQDEPLPRGCAEGDLRIVGSTAFSPVARDLGRAPADWPRSPPMESARA